MYKRLTISLVLMGLAAFSLAAGAVAWFADEGRANVTISAGTADLTFSVDLNCDGTFEAQDEDFEPGNAATFDTWDDAVPGDTTEDCIEVTNAGDGELTVYAQHSNFSGNLLDSIRFRYRDDGTNANLCGTAPGWAFADGSRFTTANGARGCELVTLPEGDDFTFRVEAEFLDGGASDDSLEGGSLGFRSTVTGYTG